jgi:hypothetical protein
MSETIDKALLITLLGEARNEVRSLRTLLLETIDQGRTLERAMDTHLLALNQRMAELKEELEQTIKMELAELVGLIGDLPVRGPGSLGRGA